MAQYRLANGVLKRYALSSTVLRNIIDGTSNQWTASAVGTNEFYFNQLSITKKPRYVITGATKLVEGSLGSLTLGQQSYGDNDSIGGSRLYVRMAADPDTSAYGSLKCSVDYTLFAVPSDRAFKLLSLIISNYDPIYSASIEISHTDSTGLVLFKWNLTLAYGSSPFALDSPIVFSSQDKLIIESTVDKLSVIASGEEI